MENKIIALTFDDGPSLDATPAILDRLEKYGVPASFFLIGGNINSETAKIVRRAFDMGCDINNHSRTHCDLTKLSPHDVRKELDYTNNAIVEITDTFPRFFRPPYIAVNTTMMMATDLAFVAGFGVEDWKPELTGAQRAEGILSQAKNGDIILMHDTAGNMQTAEALDTIIPTLKERGYELVTISELFRRGSVIPRRGVVYYNLFD